MELVNDVKYVASEIAVSGRLVIKWFIRGLGVLAAIAIFVALVGYMLEGFFYEDSSLFLGFGCLLGLFWYVVILHAVIKLIAKKIKHAEKIAEVRKDKRLGYAYDYELLGETEEEYNAYRRRH